MKRKTYPDTWHGIEILVHRKFRNGFRQFHRHNSEKIDLDITGNCTLRM